MSVEQIAAALPFLPFLIMPVWSACRLVRAARAGRWRRAGWFARAAWTAAYVDVLVWLRGILAGGLNSEQACNVWHQQPYDAAFREAHHLELFRLFPLTNPCNAYFDLVPIWVNPSLVVLTVLVLLSVAGLIWTAHNRTPTESPALERTP